MADQITVHSSDNVIEFQVGKESKYVFLILGAFLILMGITAFYRAFLEKAANGSVHPDIFGALILLTAGIFCSLFITQTYMRIDPQGIYLKSSFGTRYVHLNNILFCEEATTRNAPACLHLKNGESPVPVPCIFASTPEFRDWVQQKLVKRNPDSAI